MNKEEWKKTGTYIGFFGVGYSIAIIQALNIIWLNWLTLFAIGTCLIVLWKKKKSLTGNM